MRQSTTLARSGQKPRPNGKSGISLWNDSCAVTEKWFINSFVGGNAFAADW
jgi:hypothetical protein